MCDVHANYLAALAFPRPQKMNECSKNAQLPPLSFSLIPLASLPPPAGSERAVSKDLLIAQRGPGELIGDMGLFSKHRQRQATVRCSSKMVVRVILPDQLEDYLMQQPLARNQMRENILKKESEVGEQHTVGVGASRCPPHFALLVGLSIFPLPPLSTRQS